MKKFQFWKNEMKLEDLLPLCTPCTMIRILLEVVDTAAHGTILGDYRFRKIDVPLSDLYNLHILDKKPLRVYVEWDGRKDNIITKPYLVIVMPVLVGEEVLE